ncbi:thymidine kinase [Anopheles sinensis]|uniref:Thymidine kinase n=1 Tax=Anopheles sinensis TaxID=74873 RepID=A0A084VIC9_ANOSI|nr:thymidine kinase [Anopheles sinensis]
MKRKLEVGKLSSVGNYISGQLPESTSKRSTRVSRNTMSNHIGVNNPPVIIRAVTTMFDFRNGLPYCGLHICSRDIRVCVYESEG